MTKGQRCIAGRTPVSHSRNRSLKCSTAEVVRRLRRGDSAAVRHVRERVWKILSFRGYRLPEEDRKDLVQEIVTQIWQAVTRPGFEAGERFWGFVEVVTARRAIDWLRVQRYSSEIDPNLAASGADPLDKTIAKEKNRLAFIALSQLSEPCRELIFLHAGLDKTYKEIAQLLGKSEGALRIQMFRCVRAARRILSGYDFSSAADGSSLERSYESRTGD